MISSDFVQSIVTLLIFLGGVLSKRHGTASFLVMIAFVLNLCFSENDRPFPYGSFVSIVCFVVLLILHGRLKGGNSLLYKYNPYNPNSYLSPRIRYLLLMIATIASLATVVVLMLERKARLNDSCLTTTDK